MAEEEATLLAEAAKLPLAERAAHSLWKARVAAYEEVAAVCQRVFSSDDPQLEKFGEPSPHIRRLWGRLHLQALRCCLPADSSPQRPLSTTPAASSHAPTLIHRTLCPNPAQPASLARPPPTPMPRRSTRRLRR